nr:hypothetical protein [Tanacetum cinerariifolium]
MEFVKKFIHERAQCQREYNNMMNDRQMQSKEKKKLQIQEAQSNTVHELKVDSVVIENTCFGKENGNSRTASSKTVKESSLDSTTKDVHAIKYKMVNKIHMQTHEGKVDSSKTLDASLVVTECSGIKLDKHDTSSSSGNYITHVVDADIRPTNDQVPFVEVDSNTTPDSTNMSHRGGEIDKDIEQYQVKGQRFSLNKSSVVHEKPNTPRSYLRWIPTFKTASLRWIPTGKMFTDSTTKVDSEPPNGSNEDITNPYECDQTFNVSAGFDGLRRNNFINKRRNATSEGLRCNVVDAVTP